MPSAPLCDSRPRRPAGGNTGENDAFRRTAGVRVEDAHAVRADHPHAVPADSSVNASCARRPSAPASANPAVMTTSDLIAAAAQSSTTSSTAGAGTAMTARSTPAGRSARRGVRLQPGDFVGARVDGIDRAVEAGGDDGARARGGRCWRAVARRRRPRPPAVRAMDVATRRSRFVAVRRRAQSRSPTVRARASRPPSAVPLRSNLEPGVAKNLEHPRVFRKRRRFETAESARRRGGREPAEQCRRQAASLKCI